MRINIFTMIFSLLIFLSASAFAGHTTTINCKSHPAGFDFVGVILLRQNQYPFNSIDFRFLNGMRLIANLHDAFMEEPYFYFGATASQLLSPAGNKIGMGSARLLPKDPREISFWLRSNQTPQYSYTATCKVVSIEEN
jgi:hypothetical protein